MSYSSNLRRELARGRPTKAKVAQIARRNQRQQAAVKRIAKERAVRIQ